MQCKIEPPRDTFNPSRAIAAGHRPPLLDNRRLDILHLCIVCDGRTGNGSHHVHPTCFFLCRSLVARARAQPLGNCRPHAKPKVLVSRPPLTTVPFPRPLVAVITLPPAGSSAVPSAPCVQDLAFHCLDPPLIPMWYEMKCGSQHIRDSIDDSAWGSCSAAEGPWNHGCTDLEIILDSPSQRQSRR